MKPIKKGDLTIFKVDNKYYYKLDNEPIDILDYVELERIDENTYFHRETEIIIRI